MLSFLSVFLFAATALANPPPKAVQEMKRVVQVYVNKKNSGEMGASATAFPINKTTLMTAGHFCVSVDKFTREGKIDAEIHGHYVNQNDEIATMNGGKILRYELSDDNDLCLIEMPKHGIPPLHFAKKDNLKFGDRVYTSGAPLGSFPILTEGFVGQAYSEGMPDAILNGKILLSLPVSYGNSGGPLFNAKGEVVGVVVMVNTMYNHVSFAVPLRKIIDFMMQ
jgi:S1-C subfamily serine protease